MLYELEICIKTSSFSHHHWYFFLTLKPMSTPNPQQTKDLAHSKSQAGPGNFNIASPQKIFRTPVLTSGNETGSYPMVELSISRHDQHSDSISHRWNTGKIPGNSSAYHFENNSSIDPNENISTPDIKHHVNLTNLSKSGSCCQER
jgi:hypothetical protein